MKVLPRVFLDADNVVDGLAAADGGGDGGEREEGEEERRAFHCRDAFGEGGRNRRARAGLVVAVMTVEDLAVDVVENGPAAVVRVDPAVEPVSFGDAVVGDFEQLGQSDAPVSRIAVCVGVGVERVVVAAELDAVRGGVGEEVRLGDLAGELDAAAQAGEPFAAEVRRAGGNELLDDPPPVPGFRRVVDGRRTVDRIARALSMLQPTRQEEL